MAFLLTKEGQPLLLSDGQRVRKGSLVVDAVFGEGVVTGTVPLAHGEGLNLSIAWRGRDVSGKPPSRAAEHLHIAPFNRGDGERHTGQAFEAGRTQPRLNREQQEASVQNHFC